mmetsp:Transcript_18183/g.33744  ORF Transcript_18183/g.33744 Transcript_18183/m.33744 type:complete len:137 (-) Transcript_18183:628-1038(-)
MAFVHAGGTIIKRQLNNERIRLDTGCLVAFTPGIQFDIMFSPGLKTAFFGGEGLFLAVLKGTGTVWMQSLPFSRMADRIIQSAPSVSGGIKFVLPAIESQRLQRNNLQFSLALYHFLFPGWRTQSWRRLGAHWTSW